MERKEVSNELKWNLERLLDSQTTTEIQAQITALYNKLQSQKNTLFDSYEIFYEFQRDEEKLDILVSRLGVYFYNYVSQDTRDNKRLAHLLAYQQFITTENQKLCWLTNKLYDNEKQVRKYLVDELAIYKEQYERFFHFKIHRISDEITEVLNRFQPTISGYGQIFSTLTSADFKFPKIRDSENKYHLLTNGTYYDLFTSRDDVLRKNAYQTFWKKYNTYRNTLCTNYYNNVLASNNLATIYKYKSSLASEMEANYLDQHFFTTLLTTIKKNTNLVQKVNQLICQQLGKSNPKPWEFSKPLFPQSTKKYSADEATSIIYKATAILGKEYHNALKMLFSENAIDMMPTIGKRQGAYSYSSYRILPYICMNWTGRFNDVSTLIHELGHAVHSVFSDKTQPYPYHSYPIFLAEIASIVNELLLFEHLFLAATTKQDKLVLLENVISLFKNTVFRQAMFAEYELFAHQYVGKGKVLTADVVMESCIKICQKYFPRLPKQKYQSEYAGLWGLFVPHFYNDYYVYKYASSMICAATIISKIKKNPKFIAKYCWFLKQGCAFKPLDLLAKIAIDLKGQHVYDEAMLYFSNLIDQFAELLEAK